MASTHPPHLVAVGDALVDIVTDVDAAELERLGIAPGTAIFAGPDELERIAARHGPVPRTVGGSAANTCVAFAAAGGHASMLTVLGTDAASRTVGDDLLARSVALPIPRLHGAAVGRCLVLLLPDGERSFVIWQGEPWRTDLLRAALAQHLSRPAHRPGRTGVLVEGYLLAHADGVDIAATAEAAAADDVLVVLSLSDPRVVREHRGRFRAVLERGVDVVLGNEAEYAALGGPQVPAELAARGTVAVVTRGGRGAEVHTRSGRVATPAAAARSASSVGAGDAFAGGFLAALLRGEPAEAALLAGSRLARDVLAVASARPDQAGPDPTPPSRPDSAKERTP